MKASEKKKDKKPMIILILIIILGIIIYWYFNQGSDENTNLNTGTTQNTETTTSEATVERRTITNTITSSGEIQTELDEEIPLHSTYYLEETYFEEGDYVAEGENILKYTNGTYLTAPYNLIIAKLEIPENASQCTNSHYVEVYAIDNSSINLSVDENEIEKISVGQEVTIVPTVDTSKSYTGYITNISNSGTYSSNGSIYTAKVTFSNDGNLKIGMSAQANIILEKAEDVLAVPKEAVNNNKVIVIENNSTKEVSVEIGIENDAYIEIKSGLEEGEIVQITSQESSSNGFINYRNGRG